MPETSSEPTALPASPAPRALTLRSLLIGLPLLLLWVFLVSWSLPNDSLTQQHLLMVAGFGALFTLFALKFGCDFFPEHMRPTAPEYAFVFALVLAAVPCAVMGRMTLESAVAHHFLEQCEGGRKGIVPDVWAPNPHLGLLPKLNPPDARCPYVELPSSDSGTPRRPALEPPPPEQALPRVEAALAVCEANLQATREAAEAFARSREVLDTVKEAEDTSALSSKALAELLSAGADIQPRRAAYLAWAAEQAAELSDRGPACVHNADAVRGFRKGKSPVPWGLWLAPMAFWFGVSLCFLLMVLLFLTALRRSWVDEERLPFPYARLAEGILRPNPASPLASAQESFPSAASGIAFGVGLLFAVHGILSIGDPAGGVIPPANKFLDLDLTSLNLIRGVPIRLQIIPFVLLFMLFFPADLLFTVVLAYFTAQFAYPTVMDWLDITNRVEPRGAILRSGGMLGIFCFLLIFHVKDLKRLVTGLWPGNTDSAEVLPPRALAAGFLVALTGFCGLTILSQAHTGESLLTQALLQIYVLLMIGIYNLPFMRMRAVGGFSYFEFNHILHTGGWFNWHWWKLTHSVPAAQGAQINLPDQPLSYLSLTQLETFGAYGQSVGPGMQWLDAFSLGESAGARPREIFKALVIGLVVALGVGMPLYLLAVYHVGYDNTPMAGSWSSMYLTADKASRYYTKHNPGIFTHTSLWWVVGGALLMGGCMYLRREYSRFPIEPMGLLIAGCDDARTNLGVDNLWFTFLLAWLLKSALFRWYGVRAFQESVLPKAVYILMGMTLGMVLYLFLSAILLGRGMAF